MADKKVEKAEEAPSALKVEWEKFLAHYKAKNPKKFAEKEGRGEFKDISDDFKHSFETGEWAKAKVKLGIK